jgi:D-aspartate ligase
VTPYLQHPAVLLGGGYNALSAARTLGRSGCAVHLALDPGNPTFPTASRHARSALCPSAAAGLSEQWLEWLLRPEMDQAVVLPCSDLAIEFLACHGADLRAAGLRLPESDDRLALALLDKEETYAMARAVGVRAPRTAEVHDLEQGMRTAATFPLPFALKPRLSHRFLRIRRASPKAVVVERLEDLEPHLRTVLELDLPVILTEIVPGVDDEYRSYYGYVDATGRNLVAVTKRKLRQYPVGFGTGTYHLTDHDAEVAEAGQRLFEALGLLGLGNVEFKRDARDGVLTLIECNLRLTAATELIRRAGVDLADVVYRRALSLEVDGPEDYRDGLRQWLPVRDLLAARHQRAQGALTGRDWLSSVLHRQTFPVLDLRDPAPSLARARDLLSRTPEVASSVTGSCLTAAIPRAATSRLGRVAVGEAGVLVGGGVEAYVHRLRTSPPASGAPPGRSALYSRYWTQAAQLVGAEVEEVPGGVLRLSRRGVTTLVRDSLVQLDDPLVLQLAADKPTARALLASAGLPVSEQHVFRAHEVSRAQQVLRRMGVVVVKPARSGGGHGGTCGVRTPAELVAAFAFALRAGDRVVLERLATGQEYRLLVLDGQVIGSVLRRPPSVLGDGVSDIGGLIAAENARRRNDAAAGLYPMSVDLDLVFTLRRAGRSLRMVPAAGERLSVKTAVNENGPCDNAPVMPTPQLALAAAAAAHALGAELAAVEILTAYPSRPLADVGGTVLEVNATPGLHYHYQVSRPDPRPPVAAVLLEHLLRRAEQQGARSEGARFDTA